MRSYVQVLTTPTADTPGTTLMLHFDNKRYLLGNLAEGTQRACVQMGARLLKVSEVFLTGRTEWKNTGGMIGMILTLADSSSASQAASAEEVLRRVRAKAKKLGCLDDAARMRELEVDAKREATNVLTIFGPPNMNHMLATARRFVFRKGMPLDAHEIQDGQREAGAQGDEWAPYYADDNVKIWAMAILPSALDSKARARPKALSPRKRNIDEVYSQENATNGKAAIADVELPSEERDLLTVKAVVSEMFNSSWRLDTLHETQLSKVNHHAAVFVRNEITNKIEKFTGPIPGGNSMEPVLEPDKIVLVRKPWPGALVERLPHTEPAKEAISYIVRNHTQRGKFRPEEAKRLNVKAGPLWSELTNGKSVVNMNGETITPEQVLGASKEGGGFAVVDLPGVEYTENLTSRPEWREAKVMAGVGAIVWICAKGVATDPRLHAFMREFKHLEHVVSSPEYCPNNLALDSAAAATVRLRQVDPERYTVPVHDDEAPNGAQHYGGSDDYLKVRREYPLPDGVHIAARGQTLQLEPAIQFQTQETVLPLSIAETEAETPADVLKEAKKAQDAVKAPDAEMSEWLASLPPGAADADVTTLGTGSALPSKYRNVSATLVRVPGWGNVLLDAGENTLGQLKRVFPAEEFRQVLRDLKIIFISHMHADHQLGTTAVIKAWYEEVHDGKPAASPLTGPPADMASLAHNRLAIVSEPAMQHWLAEYSAVEDFGHSHLLPLTLRLGSPDIDLPSKLNWFIPPSELEGLSPRAAFERTEQANIPLSALNLADLQGVKVYHCHGARAVSITFPSGFKVSYSGDCRPSRQFAMIGMDSTVCIHEATFDDELQGDAEAKHHSTTSEALGVAQGMRARACVLTHFSQRYQKVPVLERQGSDALAVEDVAMLEAAENALGNPEDDLGGPLEDTAAPTLPDQETLDGSGKKYELPAGKSEYAPMDTPSAAPAPAPAPEPAAVRLKLASDMKVCVAFDYMRVRVGDIGQLEKFTPALLKLFAEEEKAKVPFDVILQGDNWKKEKKEKKKKSGKGQGQ